MSPPLTWRDRLIGGWRRRRWRGFHILRRLMPGARADGMVLFATNFGTRFLLDPLAYIDGHVIAEGYYESEVLATLRRYLRPGAVLWDVGANFGLHAVTAAYLAPGATVVAFEPNPTEHARLLTHRVWNAPQLVTSTLALSDRTGVLPLHLGPTGNSGMTSLGAWGATSENGIVNVAVAAGDKLIAGGAFPAPTVIKLDVEGHEAAVLRGLAATLANKSCKLVVFEDGRDADSEPKRHLRAAGFILEPLARRESTDHPLENFAAFRTAPA